MHLSTAPCHPHQYRVLMPSHWPTSKRLCWCAVGDHAASECQRHLAGDLHCREGAAKTCGRYPVLAQVPEPQEAHLRRLLATAGKGSLQHVICRLLSAPCHAACC